MSTNGTYSQDWLEALKRRATDVRVEYARLVHEQQRAALQLERCKAHAGLLNPLLAEVGIAPVALDQPTNLPAVGKPGNRAKDMPLRRPEWTGMTLPEIVERVLESTSDTLHAKAIVPRIYEIENDRDLKKAKHSLVSTLRAGVRSRRWEGLGKNLYSRKQGTYPAQPKLAAAV